MENDCVGLNILDLSDYALLEILKQLNATDLWQLNRTCKRFRYLVNTKKLWKKVDLRDAPLVADKITFALKRVNELTDEVQICAERRYTEIIPYDFLDGLKCTNLTVLALENQNIYAGLITLTDFPESLIELSLRKTFVTLPKLFLDRSNERLRNLKVLILDQCFWIKTIMLVQLSKYQSLEILSLYNCKHIDDSDIAYISLAGRFGFNSLKTLDCRFTGLGDQVLRTLYNKPNLREIYFQSYLSTYFLDKARRELDVFRGSLEKKHSYVTDLDDVRLFDKESLKKYFADTEFRRQANLDTVSDEGTLFYRISEASKEPDDPRPYRSVLYERPYPDCTCFSSEVNPHPFLKNKGPSCKMKSLKKRDMAKFEEIIESELRYATDDSAIRTVFYPVPGSRLQPEIDQETEGTLENRYMDWIFHRDPRNDYEMMVLEHSDFNDIGIDQEPRFLVLGNLRPPRPPSPPKPTTSNGNTSTAQSTSTPKISIVQSNKRKRDRFDMCGCPQQKPPQKRRELYVLIHSMDRPLTYKVKLTNLSLRGFKKITDKTLECLAHLDLKLLDVTLTRVTDEGVREFMLLNPNCRVVHESMCRCRPNMHL